MQSLPIEQIKPQFLHLLSSNHMVVEAETGSGKSTRLPLWASEVGRVLVIEPRRIACTSLAEYLAQQDRTLLGDRIGYAIKLQARYDEKTQVVFVTPGVALRWFAENRLSEFDIVIVDEFHERRWDTDLLVALLKEHKNHRLVITSATIEGQKLAGYIGAERLVAQGRHYRVELKYLCRDSHYLPDSRHLVENMVRAVMDNYQNTPGDILVFMPGKKEIIQCVQALSKITDAEVVRLYASVSDDERNRALKTLSRRKIVVATNVAETSLTIPGITLVIDSGLERRTLQRNGRTVLSLKAVSKASARQRAGRAGRVTDGECIRLYGEHAPLEEVTPPELLREELAEAMLASACCGFTLTELDFLEELPEKSVRIAAETLTRMEAIDSEGRVTEHGRRLYPLPIDTLYADLLTRMPTRATREAMTDLAAALSVPASIYKLPGAEDKLERLAHWEPGSCDAETLIKLVRGDAPDFIDIDSDALAEARGLSDQIREAFGLPQLEVASRHNRSALTNAIAQSHPELVFVRREKRRDALGNGEVEVVPGRNSRFSHKDEAALVLDTHSLPGRGVRQTLNLASVMMPVPLTIISDLGLGEWEQGETVTQDDKVFSRLLLRYAGRVVDTRLVEPEGDLIFKPVLEAVLNNEILPGLAEKREQEIAHWRLYVELGLDETCKEHSNLTFDQWFISQLKDLGVTELEDLSLFSEEDIPFEGIPYWEYPDFAEAHPLRLYLADLQLDVEYSCRRRHIYVVYRSGQRKGDPKRWELPKWPGWRIQYKKASRIIDVR